MRVKYVKDLLLANSRYWILSKDLVKLVGIESAFLLTNLAEAEQMVGGEDGWFFQTIDTIEELTTLSRYQQDKCIEQLTKLKWLETDIRGIPAKRYFRLSYDKIAESLINTTENKIVKNSQTSLLNTNKQDCKKLATNKEHIYKELNNKEQYVRSLSAQDKSLIISKWNELDLSQVQKLSSGTKRYDNLRARINEYGLEKVIEAIDNIRYSRFLQGQGQRQWVITFDWLVKPNNFIKVLENQYKDTDNPIQTKEIEEDDEDLIVF